MRQQILLCQTLNIFQSRAKYTGLGGLHTAKKATSDSDVCKGLNKLDIVGIGNFLPPLPYPGVSFLHLPPASKSERDSDMDVLQCTQFNLYMHTS